MMMISNVEKKVQYELCGSNLQKYSTVQYERGKGALDAKTATERIRRRPGSCICVLRNGSVTPLVRRDDEINENDTILD